jgi:hypothetical protein
MLKRLFVLSALALALVVAAPRGAHANASGVGLGVAAGLAYSNSEINVQGAKQAVGGRFAWGFFVDIPLLPTFYITPAAMLYDLKDVNNHTLKATDIDLNFKFIVPIGDLHLGAGLTGGLTSGVEASYAPHYGLLGVISYTLVANLDAFAMVQYKKMVRDSGGNISDIHAFGGGMFRF